MKKHRTWWRAGLHLSLVVVVACTAAPAEPTARVSSEAATGSVTIGMPFDGTFDRFGIAGPTDHHRVAGGDWSADVYAGPGTAIKVRSTAASAKVTSIGATCKGGDPALGGYTINVALLRGDGSTAGTAHYLHVADPRVKAGQAIGDGEVLGVTRQWPRSTCYDVTNANGVHVHFEAKGSSCWAVASKTDLGEGAALARVGGGDALGRCVGATPPATPPPPPFDPAPRPTGGPFPALHVKSRVMPDRFVSQCVGDGSQERVWLTTTRGPEPDSRWADAKYPQFASASCGAAPSGVFPLVFRSHNTGEVSGWIGQCEEDGKGTELVYRVDGVVDGHPAGIFQYSQIGADCK